MPNFNSVQLLGRCTKSPELRHVGANNTPVCNISMAVNNVTKNQDGTKNENTLFVDVTCWSRLAEIASQYIHTGDAFFLQGRLHMDKWEDKNGGGEKSKLKVIAENVQLLTGKPKSEPVPSAGVAAQRARQVAPVIQNNEFGEPDGIPFRTTIYKDVRQKRLNRNIF